MGIDYKKYSIAELETMVCDIGREIEERKKVEAESIRQKIESLLQQSGLRIDDVFSEKEILKVAKVPAKYRHPTNHSLEWSGRGKMPLWMKEFVDKGAQKEDFLIKEVDQNLL